MTFVEQLLPLRWGANLRLQRETDRLLVAGTTIGSTRQSGQSDDVWERYRTFPTDWSGNRAAQPPHIEFANAKTDDELIAFVERFGPVVASSYVFDDDQLGITAYQEMNELRDEQTLYSAALRLVAELQRHGEPDRDRIMASVREIAAKVQMWPKQWERESGLRAPEHTKPQWDFQRLSFERIENHLISAEAALRQPAPSDGVEAAMRTFMDIARDPVSLAQGVLCELINAFPTTIQPMGERKAVEWPDSDISYGIRPLLYLILRRTWLMNTVGICANERCRELFEVDRIPYCSDECSRKERQRQYWAKKGSAQRRKRKRIQEKTVPGKQKALRNSNLAAQKTAPQKGRVSA